MPVRSLAGLLGLGLVALAACGGATEPPTAAAQVVDVTARGLQFEAPDSVAAGWVTFRFHNASAMTHFVMVERLPEGKDIAAQQREVAPTFQRGADLLFAGQVDSAMHVFGSLPAWFGKVVVLGGPGLTGPGQLSSATVKLEPGTYLLECYVKTDGIFHSYNPDTTAYGMVHQFTVTDSVSDAAPPESALTITLSSTDGLNLFGVPQAGDQTFAVRFDDQKVYGNFVGHDVHLLRVADTADMNRVASWMDWTQPGGLQTPAPVVFLGGLNEMPTGSTGYFSATLTPGRYALIAEVPDPAGKGLVREFTVQ